MRTLRPYEALDGPQVVGDMWRLTRRDRTVTCTVSTHRLGWELRLTIAGELWRSQVCRTEADVFETSATWEVEAKG